MIMTIEVHYIRTADPDWCLAKKFIVLMCERDPGCFGMNYCGYVLTERDVGVTHTYNNGKGISIYTPTQDWHKTHEILFHYVEIKEGRTTLQ